MNKFAFVLAIAVFGAGYVANDVVSKLQKGAEARSDAKSDANRQYRQQLIQKLIQAKGAATGGVNLQAWGELTKEASVALDTMKIMGRFEENEVNLASAAVSSMGATSTAWRDLSSCDYSPLEAKCIEKITDTLFFAGGYVFNPEWKPGGADKIVFSASEGNSREEFKSGLVKEIEEKKKKGEKFSIVSEMLTIFDRKCSAYLNTVKGG